METNVQESSHITYDKSVKESAEKIREILALGRERAKASSTELIMAAFATCDRERWLPGSTSSATELWARLDQRQCDAVVLYLGSANGTGQ